MTTNPINPNAGTSAGASEKSNSKSKAITRHLPTVARILLGLMFLSSGLMCIFNLMPAQPTKLPDAAVAFNMGMMKTGYMFPLIYATQVVVGALLLSNRFVPLALALLAPFLVNSFAFHAFLVPQGLEMVVFAIALELYLAWSYRAAFLPMLTMKVSPGVGLQPQK
ncbi:DoxX family membrane protein [bacterium]|nr:MAG: DoxX family membrane protein [bacterium]